MNASLKARADRAAIDLMQIDNILNPSRPNAAQIKAALGVVLAIGDTIRELGQVSAGELYANVAGHMDLASFEKVLATLKGANLVSESAYMLRWTGPKLEPRK